MFVKCKYVVIVEWNILQELNFTFTTMKWAYHWDLQFWFKKPIIHNKFGCFHEWSCGAMPHESIFERLCHNPNIGFATKCERQAPMRPKMCLGVKCILTNVGECKGWNPMTPKSIPTLKVAFMWELWMFRALVGKGKNTKLGFHDTIRNFLKHICLKFLDIVHLNLIYISYDQKKKWESNWEFDS